MEEDWEAYCLMAGIAIIGEFSKPKKHIQIKEGKRYWCYQAIRLKMKNEFIINEWIRITRIWEKKLNQAFITNYFKEAHKEGDQYLVYFLPNWIYFILKEIKHFPSEYTNKVFYDRLKNWKFGGNYKEKYVLGKKDLDLILSSQKSIYHKLFTNKELAAGAFIVSFDLEFKGVLDGRPCLCMSDKYKDFLEFMLKLADKYHWSTKPKLSEVSVEYSKSLGINASPQFCFRIKISKLREIYSIAGPLLDDYKDKLLRLNIQRSSNFIKGNFKKSKTKEKILNIVRKLGSTKTTELQFYIDVGVDVILGHLNNLEKGGYLQKDREGKRYIWSIKDANKCRS